MSSPTISKEDPDLLWKQLIVQVDLYKFFFDWVLKLIIFYYTITGGAVSVYFASPNDGSKYYLLIPILLSFVLSGLFLWGRGGLKISEQELHKIQSNLPLVMRLDMRYLPGFLLANAAVCILVAITLSWFLFR